MFGVGEKPSIKTEVVAFIWQPDGGLINVQLVLKTACEDFA